MRGCQVALRDRISGQVSQGGRIVDHPLGTPGYVLRLSGRTLEASAHHQRDRVTLRHRAAARAGNQGRRIENQGAADGVQAARHDPAALAASGWRSPVAAGPRRREVRRWSSPRRSPRPRPCEPASTKGGRLIITGRSTTFDNNSPGGAPGRRRLNYKRIYRTIPISQLPPPRYTARRESSHDGVVITLRTNLRWCSDVFTIRYRNGEPVQVLSSLDSCDRKVISRLNTTGRVSGGT